MIIAENLTKDYLLLNRPRDVFRALGKKKRQYFRALDQISLEVRPGKVLGVIGSNGAGKTTLLKIIAGILKSTSGTLRVQGRPSFIFELAYGFSQFLSARENIRRMLLLEGHACREIRKLEEDIIEFSGLAHVIHKPLLTYSAGMKAKLAFAVVTSSVREVLVLDEVLSVGDEHFQGKSFTRIREICDSGRTVIIASHSIPYIERLCDRVLWLEKGKIKREGSAHEVAKAYFAKDKDRVLASYPREFGRIESIEVRPCDGGLNIDTELTRLKSGDELHLQVGIHDCNRGILAGLFNTAWDRFVLPDSCGKIRVALSFPLPPGIQRGLVSVVLLRGKGTMPGSVVEDCWGWSDGRQVYFDNPLVQASPGYVQEKLIWNMHSSE